MTEIRQCVILSLIFLYQGYLNNPSATKAAITPDGWFRTGDVAIVDSDGFYTIVDRQKELIKYKGFQGLRPFAYTGELNHDDTIQYSTTC